MNRALSCITLIAAVGAACLEPTEEQGQSTTPTNASTPCGPDGLINDRPKGAYSYPGCASEDYVCPGLKTVYCALELIRQKHDACHTDADCVAATVANQCTGYGVCNPRPAVSKSGRGAFEAEAAQDLAKYCSSNGGCFEMPSCGPGEFEAVCRGGHCAMQPADSQPWDGGPKPFDAGPGGYSDAGVCIQEQCTCGKLQCPCGTACNLDSWCGYREAPSTCALDSDCGPPCLGWTCQSGRCIGADGGCTNDEQCGAGLICILGGGYCVGTGGDAGSHGSDAGPTGSFDAG